MLNGLLDLFFPPLCIHCEAAVLRDQVLCTTCTFHLPYINISATQDHPASIRFQYRAPVEHVYASFYLSDNSMMSKLIHEFKYKYQSRIGIWLSELATIDIIDNHFPIQEFDAIIPVPIHKDKQQSRGFNQSTIIATILSKAFNIPILENHLQKKVRTASQTSKSRIERIDNMKNVFSLSPAAAFDNQKILLVDDILTTGATLESCIHAIHQASNAQISIYTLALADY